MSGKGIIFSAPMVRALLTGRKTQTRRLLSLRGYRGFSDFGPSDTPGYDWHFRRADACWCDFRAADLPLPYAPGDRLYVREAFFPRPGVPERIALPRYRADEDRPEWRKLWRPSIHMPRWASRLWLEVTDVRVQRVQEISEQDARAEGVLATGWEGNDIPAHCRIAFSDLWNSLHTKPGETWGDNPWVTALTFTVHHGNIDARGDE